MHENEKLLPPLPPSKEWLPVRHGESGDAVFRRSDGVAYAKLARGKNIPLLDEERRRTEWLASTGISCPEVLDWKAFNNATCLVTRTLPGVPASELSATELRQAWPSIVRQLKALHDLPITECPFERRLSTMCALAEEAVARGAVNPEFLDLNDRDVPPTVLLDRLREEMPQRLAQEVHELVICHGDACLPNFLIDPDTLHCTGVIDLGRLGLADRYADLSLLIANARETWTSAEEAERASTRLFEFYGLSHPDKERLDFYLRLDPLTWG
jgi:streptomycin 3"-kinase